MMFIVGSGFDRLKFLELNHFSSGMVFAIENLIKFKVSGAKMCRNSSYIT